MVNGVSSPVGHDFPAVASFSRNTEGVATSFAI